jgi:hypothetical protein
MAEQILQVSFRITIPPADYQRVAESVAPAFAAAPGLRWKLWYLDEKTGRAGGWYLFENERTLQTFLSSPLAAQVRALPFAADLQFTTAAVMTEVSAVTRAPIGAGVV